VVGSEKALFIFNSVKGRLSGKGRGVKKYLVLPLKGTREAVNRDENRKIESYCRQLKKGPADLKTRP
jgi:hypothetical protein